MKFLGGLGARDLFKAFWTGDGAEDDWPGSGSDAGGQVWPFVVFGVVVGIIVGVGLFIA